MLVPAHQRIRELERQPGVTRRLALHARELAHPVGALRLPRRDLGARELQPQAGLAGAVGERVAQERGRDVGGAAAAGVVGCVAQDACGPRLTGGLGCQQLGGDEPDVGTAGVEHPGRLQVQRRALGRGDAGERGHAHERMAPRERHGIGEQGDGRQLPRRGRRVGLGETAQRAGVGQARLVAEDRRRAGQARRGLGHRREAERHRARDGLGREPADLPRCGGVVVALRGGGKSARKLDHQQWRAARRAQACVAERGPAARPSRCSSTTATASALSTTGRMRRTGAASSRRATSSGASPPRTAAISVRGCASARRAR